MSDASVNDATATGPAAATLDPEAVLHQSPDLPWGGEFRGHAGYEDWARAMSTPFDRLEVMDRQVFTQGERSSSSVASSPARA